MTETGRFVELAPADLVRSGFAAPAVTERPWLVRWDRVDDPRQLVFDGLPALVDFHTSGTTGAGRPWRRTLDQLWHEAGMLADLIAPDRPEAALSFAPPRHLYGALATVLVPARLGLPVWYRPQYFGALPTPGAARWAVLAVPWTFSILARQSGWVRSAERLTVLHSSAGVPASAAPFLAAAGPDRVSVTEVFGSTEAGGIATRRWAPDNPPWQLFPDVSFVAPAAGGEVPLTVRSPRLASRPDGHRLTEWRTDDLVEILDERRYRFAGRAGRLAKVNGRRIQLDEIEEALRAVLDCVDLAFVPVVDPTTGDHLDLLVVPRPGHRVADGAVYEAAGRVGARPRRVHLVDRINRSETGKLRHAQPPINLDAGAHP